MTLGSLILGFLNYGFWDSLCAVVQCFGSWVLRLDCSCNPNDLQLSRPYPLNLKP